MRRVTTTFAEVKDGRTIKIDCKQCGKNLKRVVSDFQTLNPYNRNADGVPKTRGEIYRELGPRIDEKERKMREEGVICRQCGQS